MEKVFVVTVLHKKDNGSSSTIVKNKAYRDFQAADKAVREYMDMLMRIHKNDEPSGHIFYTTDYYAYMHYCDESGIWPKMGCYYIKLNELVVE